MNDEYSIIRNVPSYHASSTGGAGANDWVDEDGTTAWVDEDGTTNWSDE